jgi:hypothetical protein
MGRLRARIQRREFAPSNYLMRGLKLTEPRRDLPGEVRRKPSRKTLFRSGQLAADGVTTAAG